MIAAFVPAPELEIPMKLIIGNRNYSSWSLRPWLLLRMHGLDSQELRSPCIATTPVPHDGDCVVRTAPAMMLCCGHSAREPETLERSEAGA